MVEGGDECKIDNINDETKRWKDTCLWKLTQEWLCAILRVTVASNEIVLCRWLWCFLVQIVQMEIDKL